MLGHHRYDVKPSIRIKVISFGDQCVGKSCLIKRFCEGKFLPKYISTIGVDFGVKPVTVGMETVKVLYCYLDFVQSLGKVNFFDLAGGDWYYDIRSEFYRDSYGVCRI